MTLGNYWTFLKNLRQNTPRSARARKSDRSSNWNSNVASGPETLEVRIVPAARPTLNITANVTVDEGDTGTQPAVFNVTLSAASDDAVSVGYTTVDGTATTANGDYAAATGSLTFAPGETSKTITVQVNGDLTHEGNEAFQVMLFFPTNAKLGTDEGTGNITNDDDTPTVSIDAPADFFEGDSGTKTVLFPVTLSNPSSLPVTVHFATSDDTATVDDDDYDAASGTLTFAPGETTKNVSVVIHGDTDDETDETFDVTLSVPTSSTLEIGSETATATIGDDDNQPTINVNNPSPIDEGNTGTVTLLFTVRLSSASTQTVTVAYATADGTATIADNDYTAASGTLTFAPGQLTKEVSVTVKGDTRNEANETIRLLLSAPTNGRIGNGTGTATITDEDVGQPSVNVSTGISVTEGNTGTVDVVFHVTLASAASEEVTVNIATAGGTATVADGDYTQKSETITFAIGETDKTFTVQVKGDTKPEANETFKAVLTDATGATIGVSEGTATINNDDSTTVHIVKTTDAAETTPLTNGKFTVIQGAVSSTDTVIEYEITGTATPGDTGDDSDYQTLTGTVTIPAGQTSAVINVIPFHDSEEEEMETVIVTLTGFTSEDPNVVLDSDETHLTATVNIADVSEVTSVDVGGPAVTFAAGDKPIKVLPQAVVTGNNPGGGTLIINVNEITAGKKKVDKFKFAGIGSIGKGTTQRAAGQLILTIELKTTVTPAAIQEFLRGITFSTKNEGLNTATRTLAVSLEDAAHHASGTSQTINVTTPP